MSHFSASESDGNLDLVSGAYELACMIDLCFKVMRVNVERKPDLFDLNDLLILSGFLFSLCLFKAELAVIHNFANGRFGCGSNLNEVKILALCDFKSFRCGHDAELLTVVGDNSYLFVTDFLIDLLFFAADVKAPPEMDSFFPKLFCNKKARAGNPDLA